MRLLQLVTVLLIGAGASVASVFSRQDPDRQIAEFSGTIAAVDDVSLRIRPDEGSVMTFVVDDPGSLPPVLAAGTRVTVQYETREGGGRRLLSVALAPGADAAPPLEASPLRAPAALALASQPREAESARAAGRCPLQLVAVALLVATGGLLVIASWR